VITKLTATFIYCIFMSVIQNYSREYLHMEFFPYFLKSAFYSSPQTTNVRLGQRWPITMIPAFCWAESWRETELVLNGIDYKLDIPAILNCTFFLVHHRFMGEAIENVPGLVTNVNDDWNFDDSIQLSKVQSMRRTGYFECWFTSCVLVWLYTNTNLIFYKYIWTNLYLR
jgi:hypothetical protein